MEKLQNDATLEEVIAKINEIVERFDDKTEEMYIAPNVQKYYDGLGGDIQ